jgi:cyanophycin synthetase
MLTLEAWKYYKGCVLGVRSPAWCVELTLPETAAPAVQRLCSAVTDLTGETQKTEALSAQWRVSCALKLAWAAVVVQRFANRFVPHDTWAKDLQDQRVQMLVAAPDADRARRALGRLVELASELNAQATASSPTKPAAPSLEDALSALVRELATGGDTRVNVYMLEQAAHARGLPVIRCNPQFYVIGTGAKARVFNSTITDRTPALGVSTAKNKLATATLLRLAGLPGTLNRRVADAQQAWIAAEALGLPVVVKPNDLDRGEGVFADLRTHEEVTQAYAQASTRSRQILVEKWVPGYTHRLSVFENQVVHVSKRIAGGVTGDGMHSVAQLLLMRQQSADAQRKALRRGVEALTLDEEALALLAREGLDASSVPPPGQYVRLRRRDNINAGGTNERCDLAAVHPDNIRLAVDAARLLRLDFAGIDLLIQDIGQSWLATGGAICEVNAQPQLRAGGDPTVYAALFQRLFPDSGLVPMHVVVTPDAQALDPALARALAQEHPGALVAAASGLWLGDRYITPPFADGHAAAIAALLRPDAAQVVCVLGITELLHKGLPTFGWRRLTFREFKNPLAWQEPLREARRLVDPFFSSVNR